MSGFLAFLGKELAEITRTWRLWVLPGLLLFAALSGPVLAEITPSLVRSLASDEPGVVIELPDPVPLDAYRQFTTSLTQLVLLALIISTAGLVSGEVRGGTVALVLPKPVSRAGFILAKVIAWGALLVISTTVAVMICWIATLVIFGDAPVAPLAWTTVLWVLYAVMFVSVMTLLSVLINPVAGAAGAGIVVYFIMTILALWQPAREYTTAGVFSGIEAVLDESPDLLLPVVAAVVASVALLVVAIWLFSRQDLTSRVSRT